MKHSRQQGIAILYAVLLVTIIISIGLILIDIITKQIVLSSVGKNSQFAYYAANAGKECAFFWDSQPHAFDPDASGTLDLPDRIHCAGRTLDLKLNSDVVFGDGTNGYTILLYENSGLGFSEGNWGMNIATGEQGRNVCSRVTISKKSIGNNAYKTEIESRGYNTPCDTVGQGNRAVERTVVLK